VTETTTLTLLVTESHVIDALVAACMERLPLSPAEWPRLPEGLWYVQGGSLKDDGFEIAFRAATAEESAAWIATATAEAAT
jgi:hypothetical protein